MYHEDRGLTILTTYQYRITVHNDFGYTVSPLSVNTTTFGGKPQSKPEVTAFAPNHISIIVNWTTPSKIMPLISIHGIHFFVKT